MDQIESGTSESGFLKFEKWKVKKKSFHSFPRSAKWKKYFHSFSRSEKWKKNAFTLFREVQSENKMLSLYFQKWKVKWKWNENASRLRSENSREFLTILEKRDFWTDLFRESQIRLLKQMACSWGINHLIKISRLNFLSLFSAEVWFRHEAQGLVKILKLKFGQYFEGGAYLRFDNFWKYNWEQR